MNDILLALGWPASFFLAVLWIIHAQDLKRKLNNAQQRIEYMEKWNDNSENFVIYAQMRGKFDDYYAKFFFDPERRRIVPDPEGTVVRGDGLAGFNWAILQSPHWREVEGVTVFGFRQVVFDFMDESYTYHIPPDSDVS